MSVPGDNKTGRHGGRPLPAPVGAALGGGPAFYFFAVVSGKSSVRNGTAGSPSLLKKFSVGSAKLTLPNRTAVGFGTSAQVSTTASPAISALAGRNFLPPPAHRKPGQQVALTHQALADV